MRRLCKRSSPRCRPRARASDGRRGESGRDTVFTSSVRPRPTTSTILGRVEQARAHEARSNAPQGARGRVGGGLARNAAKRSRPNQCSEVKDAPAGSRRSPDAMPRAPPDYDMIVCTTQCKHPVSRCTRFEPSSIMGQSCIASVHDDRITHGKPPLRANTRTRTSGANAIHARRCRRGVIVCVGSSFPAGLALLCGAHGAAQEATKQNAAVHAAEERQGHERFGAAPFGAGLLVYVDHAATGARALRLRQTNKKRQHRTTPSNAHRRRAEATARRVGEENSTLS